jgi:hypothetical protein
MRALRNQSPFTGWEALGHPDRSEGPTLPPPQPRFFAPLGMTIAL